MEGHEDGADNGDGDATDAVPFRKMSIHQIWTFFQESRAAGISAEKLAEVRKSDDQGGVKTGTVSHWQRKLLGMYLENAKLSFLNVNHIACVADGSKHSNKEFLVSVFYSYQNKVGCMGMSQQINSSKVLFPGQMNLTEEAERLAARHETERLAALKFIQAISHQISLLSNGRLEIKDFKPNPQLLQVLQPSPETSVIEGRRYIKLQEQDEPVEIVMPYFEDLPCLCLIMDQSTIGSAAGAWLNDGNYLVHFCFDKIHRLIRDLKAANDACPGLEETLLMTTYAWSINYKPFKSGGFFTEKGDALNGFLETHSVET